MTAEIEKTEIKKGDTFMVPVDKLRDRRNVRTTFHGIENLAVSMGAVGQLHELIVVPDVEEPGCWEIRSGARRFRAVRDFLKWESLRCTYPDLDELHAELAALDVNLQNDPLRDADLDFALKRQKEIYEILYPETTQGSNQWTRAAVDDIPKRFTQQKAEQLGVSETTVKDAIRRAENLSTPLGEMWKKGEIDKTEANVAATLPKPVQDELLQKALAADNPKEVRKILRQGLREEAQKKKQARDEKRLAKLTAQVGDAKLPQTIDLKRLNVKTAVQKLKGQGFQLVHADPDWKYDNNNMNGSANKHYVQDTMNSIAVVLDQAYDCAADDAYLLLWVTFPLLREWFDATYGGEELRWEYKSGGSWHKLGNLGVGFHWRGNAELLLLYTKGNPRPYRDDLSNAFESTRTQHSEKPEEWLRKLIATFSKEGDKVLDLWAGMAPCGRACLLEGRSYVGVELDEARHKEATLLLSQMQQK